MNFIQAVEEMVKGNKVHIAEWPDNQYLYIQDGQVIANIVEKGHIHANSLICDSHMQSGRWKVYNEPMSFQQACEAMYKGKKVTREYWCDDGFSISMVTNGCNLNSVPTAQIEDYEDSDSDIEAEDWIVVE